MKTKPVQMRLTAEQYERLKQLAERNHRSMGAQALHLLEQAIADDDAIHNGVTQIDMDAMRDPAMVERVR